MAYAGDRCIAVLLGVFAQQFVRQQRTVRLSGNDICEGAAAINPELPAFWRKWR